MLVAFSLILLKLGVVGVYWSIPGSIALYFLLTKKWAIVANVFLIGTLGSVAFTVLEIQLVTRYIAVLLGANIFSVIAVSVINRQRAKLHLMALSDPLTGLYNRLLLQDSLEHAKHQYNRSGIVMSLIMIDIDYFKSINDDLGHDAGDRVLQSFAELLNRSFRGADMIFRTGGEEFLVLVYDSDKNKSRTIAEKFRQETEQHKFFSNRKVTVSIGVSEISPEQGSNQWLKHCDHNLYHAKHAGRNQVVA